MTALTQHPYAQALAWTLVNFLWQGAAIAAAAFLLLRLARDRATWQYAIGVGALGLMLAAPVATFTMLAGGSTPALSSAGGAAAVKVALLSTNQPPALPGRSALPSVPIYQVLVIGLWLTGVSILSLRLFGGWVIARRLTRRATRPVGPEILVLAERAASRLHLARVVSILESSLVSVPMIVGWIKPAVLLPAAALSGLTPDQIEALLAHELAHVRRHDYLVNLLQSGVETLLFYHPAVWWVSRQVREAREHCCDDLAVAASDRLVYATALADLASMVAAPRLALAATDGSLVARVRRILGGSNETPRTSLGWVPICAVLCVVGALVPTGFVSAEEKSPIPAAAVVEKAPQEVAVEAERQVAAPRPNRAEVQAIEQAAAQEREREVLAESVQQELSAQALAELKKKIELAQRELDGAKARAEVGAQSQAQIDAAIRKLNEAMVELKMRKELEPEQVVSADLEIAKIKQDQMRREYERAAKLYEKGLVTKDTMAQAETKLKLAELSDQSQVEKAKLLDEALAQLARAQEKFDVGLLSQAQLNDAMAAAKNRQELVLDDVKRALAQAERSKTQLAYINGEAFETDFGPLSPKAMELRDRVPFDGSLMSGDALGAVLKDAARLDSDVDRAGVLVAVAERQWLTPELVTLYVTAAKGIKSDEIRAKVFAHPIHLKQVR